MYICLIIKYIGVSQRVFKDVYRIARKIASLQCFTICLLDVKKTCFEPDFFLYYKKKLPH